MVLHRKCSICGVEGILRTRQDHDSWDWFTGFLPETFIACPKHKNSLERNLAFAESQIKKSPKGIRLMIAGDLGLDRNEIREAR